MFNSFFGAPRWIGRSVTFCRPKILTRTHLTMRSGLRIRSRRYSTYTRSVLRSTRSKCVARVVTIRAVSVTNFTRPSLNLSERCNPLERAPLDASSQNERDLESHWTISNPTYTTEGAQCLTMNEAVNGSVSLDRSAGKMIPKACATCAFRRWIDDREHSLPGDVAVELFRSRPRFPSL